MKKIAFFDSGIGGLSVLHEALQIMPNEQYIYFADSNHAPYGIKSSSKIKQLVFNAVEFLSQLELKALVVACNTATSVAIKDLRKMYNFPIIGMEPAVKLAIESSLQKKTLVCATDRTLAENKLRLLINDLGAADRVERLSLQNLVLLAENFELNSPNVKHYLMQRFSTINWNEFDSIVLGCTHFLFFKDAIRKVIPKQIRILDGNQGTVKQLQSRLIDYSPPPPSPIQYFRSKKLMPTTYFDYYFNMLNQQTSL